VKLIIAKTAGFCMGVQRAVDMALEAAQLDDSAVKTLGPLIHNPQVLSFLKTKEIEAVDRIPTAGSGTILIRAHGVPPIVKSALEESDFKVIDATCPRVIKVQTIIDKFVKKGYASIIIGDKNHPEVVGLLGYAGENGYVVEGIDALARLPVFEKAIIVAQTTQNTADYATIKAWAEQKRPLYKIFHTICDSTEKRQEEVRCLAATVDIILIIGGYNSGNTKRLFEIAKQLGKPAFHIETEADLDYSHLSGAQSIGISAGASTPEWIIKRVCQALKEKCFKEN
jgi:4-hydroxy-3-methylbut-2-enyl diphosphate reductase